MLTTQMCSLLFLLIPYPSLVAGMGLIILRRYLLYFIDSKAGNWRDSSLGGLCGAEGALSALNAHRQGFWSMLVSPERNPDFYSLFVELLGIQIDSKIAFLNFTNSYEFPLPENFYFYLPSHLLCVLYKHFIFPN